MNGIFFYIGLGVGLAAACGLRPFLPLLLAGALAPPDALGVTFGNGHFHFLQAGWWLLVVTVTLVARLRAQLVLGLAPTAELRDERLRPRPAGGGPRGARLRRRRRCCSRARSTRTATPGGPA